MGRERIGGGSERDRDKIRVNMRTKQTEQKREVRAFKREIGECREREGERKRERDRQRERGQERHI